jgi:hypothetical protein
VCEDIPEIRKAMEISHYLTTYDIKSYEKMTAITQCYNKAVDKFVAAVSVQENHFFHVGSLSFY